ncbi:MAG: VOC family protein [bacterium]
MLTFDHIAVSAMTLAEGVAHVEQALGVPLAGGGQHPHMATHNRLLALGDLYLEVIAADPALPRPPRPRWFNLDNFSGAPDLTNWVARTDDLQAALAGAPKGTGTPVALSRGQYHWQMAVPADGKLPFDGAFPALIQWQPPHHPTRSLPDQNVRLTRLEITHPEAAALRAALKDLTDDRIQITQGPHKALRASFQTPHGPRHLA